VTAAATHIANVFGKVATDWPAFKTDPAWCLRYLELAADFLTTHRTFTAELPLVHAVSAGLHSSERLAADCWCEGHDMLMQLGWAVPISQLLHGSKQWMSLL